VTATGVEKTGSKKALGTRNKEEKNPGRRRKERFRNGAGDRFPRGKLSSHRNKKGWRMEGRGGKTTKLETGLKRNKSAVTKHVGKTLKKLEYPRITGV